MHFLKKGQKIRAWVDPPPHSGNARKKTFFFSLMSSLIIMIFQMRHKDNEGEIFEPVNAKRADAAMRACPVDIHDGHGQGL